MSADAAFVQDPRWTQHLALFLFPTRRIQPVPDGSILLVLRNHLEDLIPPLALVQVQPPPPRSERREAASPPSACSVDRSERNKRASCQLWFLEPCRLVFHPVGSGHLQSTQSSCVRLTLLSAERSRRYKCAFVRSPSLAEIAMAIRPEALQGSGSSGLIFLLV